MAMEREIIDISSDSSDSDNRNSRRKSTKSFVDIPAGELAKARHALAGVASVQRAAVGKHCYQGRVCMTYHVSLDALIDRPNLQKSIVSSFAHDDEWFMPKLKGPVVVLRHRPPDIPRELDAVQSGNALYVFPAMVGAAGSMHVKLLLLFYDHKIRVIIPSANLIQFDWEEMENVLYYQDFPRGNADCEFKSILKESLTNMKVPIVSLNALDEFDFTAALGRLVYSRPGTFSDIGLQRLSKVVLEMHIPPSMPIRCITSSLGKTDGWIQQMHSACRGGSDEPGDIMVYFPSRDTVLTSRLGKENSSSLFYDARKYPCGCLYDLESVNAGELMHAKIILCSDSKDTVYIADTSEDADGYMYAGSHNFTGAAWGRPLKSRQEVRMTNWELGMMFKLSKTKTNMPFVIPFRVPGRRNLKPWSSGPPYKS